MTKRIWHLLFKLAIAGQLFLIVTLLTLDGLDHYAFYCIGFVIQVIATLSAIVIDGEAK